VLVRARSPRRSRGADPDVLRRRRLMHGRGGLRRAGDRRLTGLLLRHLAALTRPIPVAGPRALAVAVYSDARGEQTEARESGVEGVACVDDAARAGALLYRLWAATG